MTDWVLQGPDEVRAYDLAWPLNTGENIEESIWTISPDLGPNTGEGLEGDVLDTAGMVTQVIVSGLFVGLSYQLKNVVRTNEGRTLSQEITIRCSIR